MFLIKPVQAIVCNPVIEKDCLTNGTSAIGSAPTVYANSVVQTVISLFFIAGIIYFLFHFILAAYHMIASRGDPKKYEEAMHALTYSLTGFVIILSVFAVLKLIGTIFGIGGLDGISGIVWPSL